MNRAIKCWLLVIVFGAFSCETDVKINDYLDKSDPFELTIHSTNSETRFTDSKSVVIDRNDKRWAKIIDWGKNNSDGWQSSPASHIGDTYLKQGDFRMIYTKNTEGVIVAFIDEEGNPKQYSKRIASDELSFLYE